MARGRKRHGYARHGGRPHHRFDVLTRLLVDHHKQLERKKKEAIFHEAFRFYSMRPCVANDPTAIGVDQNKQLRRKAAKLALAMTAGAQMGADETANRLAWTTDETMRDFRKLVSIAEEGTLVDNAEPEFVLRPKPGSDPCRAWRELHEFIHQPTPDGLWEAGLKKTLQQLEQARAMANNCCHEIYRARERGREHHSLQ